MNNFFPLMQKLSKILVNNYLWVSRLHLPLKSWPFVSFTLETALENEVHFGLPRPSRLCHPLRKIIKFSEIWWFIIYVISKYVQKVGYRQIDFRRPEVSNQFHTYSCPIIADHDSQWRPIKDCAIWYDVVLATPWTACKLVNGWPGTCCPPVRPNSNSALLFLNLQ